MPRIFVWNSLKDAIVQINKYIGLLFINRPSLHGTALGH